MSKGQICSDPKGHTLPMQWKVANTSDFTSPFPFDRAFYKLTTYMKFQDEVIHLSYSNWENSFVFFPYNDTFYFYSNLRSAQFSLPYPF